MSDEFLQRRSALARIVTAGMSVITAGLAGLVGLVAVPRASAAARRWRKAASLFDVPASQPMAAVIAERTADGWYETRSEQVVFIDREGEGYRAFSATCTHLGCRVRWDSTKSQYLCPCHGGVYDREGRVVDGPPPRGLDRIPVRVNKETSAIEVEL